MKIAFTSYYTQPVPLKSNFSQSQSLPHQADYNDISFTRRYMNYMNGGGRQAQLAIESLAKIFPELKDMEVRFPNEFIGILRTQKEELKCLLKLFPNDEKSKMQKELMQKYFGLETRELISQNKLKLQYKLNNIRFKKEFDEAIEKLRVLNAEKNLKKPENNL